MVDEVLNSLFKTGTAYVSHKLFRLLTARLDNSYPEIRYQVSVDKKKYYTIQCPQLTRHRTASED